MIKKKGDVFNTWQNAIGHGVNCKGVMGAGIAVSFKTRYPDMFKAYERVCEKDILTPGNCMAYRVTPDRIIMNMATQDYPGANAKLSLIYSAAKSAALQVKNIGVWCIAIPMIGTGIGGLDWSMVEKELIKVEELTGVEFEVWQYV